MNFLLAVSLEFPCVLIKSVEFAMVTYRNKISLFTDTVTFITEQLIPFPSCNILSL